MLKTTLTLFIFCFVINAFGYAQSSCDSTAFYNGVELHRQGKFNEAIQLYTQQISTCPGFVNAYINRGFCFYLNKQRDSANHNFTLAVKVSTEKQYTIYSIANVFFNWKQYDTAFLLFRQSTLFDTTFADAYYHMGRCKWLKRVGILHQTHNDTDYTKDPVFKAYLKNEILEYYNKAIFIDSAENAAFYASRNQMDALKDMNTHYAYYYDRGLLKVNFGDYKGALADFEQSNIVHPTISGYHYAAYIARMAGEKEKACRYIQTWAVMVSPGEDMNVIQKKEAAEKFCKELGQK
jgi:tetratricopeptide (TPR) repeat protein